MLSARTLGIAVAAVVCAASLTGCMSMMMSAEQKQQTCDSYVSMMTMPQVTAEQRKQAISAMKQMDCPNIPPA